MGFEDPPTETHPLRPPSLPAPSTDGAGTGQPERAKPLPSWFPAQKEDRCPLTEEDLAFDTDPLKLRRPRR
jgi:hypothetical protein